MADESALPSIETELPTNELYAVSIDADILLEDAQDAGDGPNPYGFTWAFDFQAGDIFVDTNGAHVVVTEKDTLKQWIGHTLSIARGETSLYSENVGTEIPYLLGSAVNAAEVITRIKDEVKAALLTHDKVADVNEVVVFPVGESIYIFVDYVTDDQQEVTDVIGL